MKEKQLFEYAVIRVVPRVEREEFLNVGVILYCHKKKSLHTKYKVDEQRLCILSPDFDIDELEKHLRAFEAICNGGAGAGPIGELDAPSRFRWLTAPRSTILQCSKVHPGFCDAGDKAIERLFGQLVG